ncbi:MAG TPA: hypothetical protein VFD26_05475 [Methyloceanibacter sp.]|nr:hypothetical protein [Methyloceanibacter sp.]
MPVRLRIAAGLMLAAALIGLAGFKAYSAKLGPLVQAYGTTYYNGDGPNFAPVACKPESEIVVAIKQVHAKYDYLEGADLRAFEQRAAALKGLPPLNVEKLYVITEDDQLRNGEMVLFIGLRVNCVTTVFGLPTKLYRELIGKSDSA